MERGHPEEGHDEVPLGLWLNVIEEYNIHMNSTDVADQLRGNYCPDQWMCQRKWWLACFIWSIGVT